MSVIAVYVKSALIQQSSHRWPIFLPDGKHFLFFSREPQNTIYVASLGSSERKPVLKNDSNVLYVSPGYLLYVRNHSLLAQAFDTKRLELTGIAVAIAEDAPVNGTTQRGAFSASENGILSLQTEAGKFIQPVWVDRSGKVLDMLGDPAIFQDCRVSPNGERVAFMVMDPQEGIQSIWIYDSSGQRKTRLTFGPHFAFLPTWSPDSNRIVFASNLNVLSSGIRR